MIFVFIWTNKTFSLSKWYAVNIIRTTGTVKVKTHVHWTASVSIAYISKLQTHAVGLSATSILFMHM